MSRLAVEVELNLNSVNQNENLSKRNKRLVFEQQDKKN